MKQINKCLTFLIITVLSLSFLPSCATQNYTVLSSALLTIMGTGTTLSNITITKPAAKRSYYVGDSLSIAGLEVTGTYNNGGKKVLSITTGDVSGFDSTAVTVGQTLTIDIGGKTATYQISVNPLPEKPSSQGLSPFDIEITKDGQYAYLCFDGSEVVLYKVRLSDLTVVSSADLSGYFPMECENIALDASEKNFFAYSPTWRKLLVLNTDTMEIIHTIDNYGLIGMIRSKFGSRLITWDGGSTAQIIDTDTYAITKQQISDLFVIKITEDEEDQTKWYAVTQELPGGQGPLTVGLFDTVAKEWINPVTVPLPAEGTSIFDFCVLPGGQKAYVSTFDGWYPDYHAYGSLCAIDFKTKNINTLPIDGGAMCLAVNPLSLQLFVGTGWPSPNTNNLLIVDTVSDSITQTISLDKNTYGRAYTQMNRLEMDPARRFLYATSSDGNALIKIDADNLNYVDANILNNETFHPNNFVRLQSQPFGYILISKSARSFEFNLDKAEIQNVVAFPEIRQDAYSYDVGVSKTGRLLIAQGEQFLEVDPQNMQLIATHALQSDIPSIWSFVLSRDKTKIYSVTQFPADEGPHIFVAMNAITFEIEKQFVLTGGIFESRPYELPDSPKIYALGGLPNGQIVIQVISTADYTIQKTITFDQPDYNGISAGPYYPYAYDAASHTLYIGATNVVLAVDTITDVVKKVIYLRDLGAAIGLPQPEQLETVNAVGLVYNPKENYLYIAHGDGCYISIFDLTNNQFFPFVIPVKGYMPNMLFANDGCTKLYTTNPRSDSISVIDIASKKVEKVIDLHSYLSKP